LPVHESTNPTTGTCQAEALDEGIHTVIASKEAQNQTGEKSTMGPWSFPVGCGPV
jgi:hypothetical protein